MNVPNCAICFVLWLVKEHIFNVDKNAGLAEGGTDGS